MQMWDFSKSNDKFNAITIRVKVMTGNKLTIEVLTSNSKVDVLMTVNEC